MKNFYQANIDSTLICKDEVENVNDRNQRRLRRDLYGLPDWDLYENCGFLGLTMYYCVDPLTHLPIWSYQRVDLNDRERTRRTAELRRNLRHIYVAAGLTRGHLSTMQFCANDYDAEESCDFRNIVAQTEVQNNWCCKKWEDAVYNRMDVENFIAHITTVVVYEKNAQEHEHSMLKILVEEHAGQSLQMKCYLIYEANVVKYNWKQRKLCPPCKRIGYAEVSRITNMNYLNYDTIEKLRQNNLVL